MLFSCVKNSYSSFKAPSIAPGLFSKVEVRGRDNHFLFCDVLILCIFADYSHHAAIYLMSFSTSTVVLLEVGD